MVPGDLLVATMTLGLRFSRVQGLLLCCLYIALIEHAWKLSVRLLGVAKETYLASNMPYVTCIVLDSTTTVSK